MQIYFHILRNARFVATDLQPLFDSKSLVVSMLVFTLAELHQSPVSVGNGLLLKLILAYALGVMPVLRWNMVEK